MYEGCIIMQGTRNTRKLWTIDPPSPTTHSLNSIIDAPAIADRIKFRTTSLFSPTLSTLAQVISTGYLTTFPSFTAKQLRKFPPKLEGTQMGHLHAKRSGLASAINLIVNITLDTGHPSHNVVLNERCHNIATSLRLK